MLTKSDFHNYQVTAKQYILDNPFCALFLDMGLGKTITSLTAIQELIYEEIEIDSVLVIAPKRVAESVWTAEAKKWAHTQGLKISLVIGTEKQRKAALREKADIYMLGRDNTVWLCGQYGGSMLPFDMLVIDESSSYKDPKSQRFKALKMVQACFKRIVLLTGTPAPNGLIGLWSQIWLLDRGARLGKTITSYRENFFNPGKRNGAIIYDYKIQNDGEQRIHEKIADICMSMKAKDYLDLPERIDNYIKIEFPKALKKQYDDFEKEQVLELFSSDQDITAVNSAALSNKLLQFANGAIYDEDRNVHDIHDLKLEALAEILENTAGKPVLIAYTYRSDLDRILAKFKKYGIKKLETDKDINDWNAGRIPAMIMHPASGGHGLNLQAGGNIIVWYGQTWSLELYQQFNARLNRQGQTRAVIINHLISAGTIDEEVIKSLEDKDHTQEGLMQAVKARIRKYKNNF